MLNTALTDAITAKIENLNHMGSDMAGIAELFRAHAPQPSLDQFGAANGLAPGALSVGTVQAAPGGEGTVGALALSRCEHGVSDIPVSLLWRIVLGLEDRPSSDWACASYDASQRLHVESALWIGILQTRLALISPEVSIPVYDLLADAWMKAKTAKPLHEVDWSGLWNKSLEDVRAELNVVPLDMPASNDLDEAEAVMLAPEKFSAGLSEMMWATINKMAVDPFGDNITILVAAYGSTYSPEFFKRTESLLWRFDGMKEAFDHGLLPKIEIETLKDKPVGTLGNAFYRVIKDNNFDVEVLDPDNLDATGVEALPGVDFTSRRILQSHDLWHITANYFITPLHEISISGFQFAQFGQNYSACFLSTIQFISMFGQPLGLPLITHLTYEGWQHGRRTPPMLLIDWHQQWDKSIDEVRAEFGITPYQSLIDDRIVPNPTPVAHERFETLAAE